MAAPLPAVTIAPGAEPVAVLSHRYWQQNMSGRDAVLGQTLQIGREHFTIVGVLSPGIEFGNIAEIDVWLPLRIDPAGPRDARNLRFFARLKPGVEFEQAAAEMAAIGDALAREHPETNGGWRMRLAHVSELTGGDGFWVIIALFVLSIGLLIAIATANVSNLVLARTLGRARELAVRTALGARRGRLVRQFVTEGFVLCLAAALVALPLAWAGLQAIGAASPEVVFQQLTIDLHEMGFVAAVTLVCPLVFSIAPLRVLSRPDMRQVLAGSGDTRGHRVDPRPRRAGRGAGGAGGGPADRVEPVAAQRPAHLLRADRPQPRRRAGARARVQRRAVSRRGAGARGGARGSRSPGRSCPASRPSA